MTMHKKKNSSLVICMYIYRGEITLSNCKLATMYMNAIYEETGLCESTFFRILKKVNVVPQKAEVRHSIYCGNVAHWFEKMCDL